MLAQHAQDQLRIGGDLDRLAQRLGKLVVTGDSQLLDLADRIPVLTARELLDRLPGK